MLKNRLLSVLVQLLLIVSLSTYSFAEGTNSSETMHDVGVGMQVGGTPSAINGSPLGAAVVGTGILVDLLSGILGGRKLDMSDPKVKEKFEATWSRQAKLEMLFQNRAMLKPTTDTTPEQIKTQAASFCADLDKRAAMGGTLQISRKKMKLFKVPDEFLPADDGTDVIQYKLAKNPMDNCTQVLAADSERAVCRLKKRSDCEYIGPDIVAMTPPPPTEKKARQFYNMIAGRGGISEENVTTLKRLLVGSTGVSFKPFGSSEPDLKKLSCRLGKGIQAPRTLTFARFVEESLAAQFITAGKYSGDSPISLSGTLTAIDVSAPMSGSGGWKMSLEVVDSNGRKASISSEYGFDGAFSGEEACGRARDTLIPAVDKLVSDLIKSPDFAAMLSGGQPQTGQNISIKGSQVAVP